MNRTAGRYDSGIKPQKRFFWIAAFLCLAVATLWTDQKRSRRIQLRAQDGLSLVRQATENRRDVLASLRKALPEEPGNDSPEGLIYGRIDQINARLKPDEMTIATLERRGGELSLQYTLLFVDPGYCELLNAVGYLQQGTFLFTPVNSLAVSRNGKGGISYVIKGTVLLPEGSRP
jgi:type II secretory pathway pseudopilin PulG